MLKLIYLIIGALLTLGVTFIGTVLVLFDFVEKYDKELGSLAPKNSKKIDRVTEYLLSLERKKSLRQVFNMVTQIAEGIYSKIVNSKRDAIITYSFFLTAIAYFIGKIGEMFFYLFGGFERMVLESYALTMDRSQNIGPVSEFPEIYTILLKYKVYSILEFICQFISIVALFYYILKQKKKHSIYLWIMDFSFLLVAFKLLTLISDSRLDHFEGQNAFIAGLIILVGIYFFLFRKYIYKYIDGLRSFLFSYALFFIIIFFLAQILQGTSPYNVKFSLLLDSFVNRLWIIYLFNLLFDYLTIVATLRVLRQALLKEKIHQKIELLIAGFLISLLLSAGLYLSYSYYIMKVQIAFGAGMQSSKVMGTVPFLEMVRSIALISFEQYDFSFFFYSCTTFVPYIVYIFLLLIVIFMQMPYRFFRNTLRFLLLRNSKEKSNWVLFLLSIGILLMFLFSCFTASTIFYFL